MRATTDTALDMLARGLTSADCPAAKQHTSMPEGYLDWHDAAEALQTTHAQKQCHACGFWVIWKPKRSRR